MDKKGICPPNSFKPKEAILTIPNIITSLGFVFTGLYVWSFLSNFAVWKIFSFLFLAGCTDSLDGFSARFLRQETKLGEILDPVRDRVLMIAILWNFWLVGNGGARFLICVVLTIEATVSILNAKIKEDGYEIYHFYGKVRQTGHLFCAVLFILGVAIIETALFAIFVFSVIAFYGATIGCLAKKEERRMVWTDLD